MRMSNLQSTLEQISKTHGYFDMCGPPLSRSHKVKVLFLLMTCQNSCRFLKWDPEAVVIFDTALFSFLHYSFHPKKGFNFIFRTSQTFLSLTNFIESIIYIYVVSK